MSDKPQPIPPPGIAELYMQQKLNDAHHMICVLLEANAGLQAKNEELEKNQKKPRKSE